jgi:hypothetical protein
VLAQFARGEVAGGVRGIAIRSGYDAAAKSDDDM